MFVFCFWVFACATFGAFVDIMPNLFSLNEVFVIGALLLTGAMNAASAATVEEAPLPKCTVVKSVSH
jgi:hypothetical protein